ncbi:hypothetical protein ELI15_17305 [Rhizobium ruizarguesonis]|uniref:hypothetical protein n=1 Tax=Rhizobium TaxID=379 RepID=UPI0010301680|nr:MULTISPECIES: hypothetical protein [Rhizobium]TAW53290.1 hypothetical protein ELI14_19300 [Rhizobium leguminosarum]TAW66017.1 hypothetical protein ELI15_17305 [Rhizobium ruizarguesonis]
MGIHFMEDVSRLKSLIADLEKLEADPITKPELMANPTLDNWLPSACAVSCVEGEIEGNLGQRSGHRLKTSQTFAIVRCDDESFVRTLDRWYRLGTEGIR